MKTQCAGRDYIIVNAADTSATDVTAMARKLCSRHVGVGADGLAVVEHLGRARFAIRCFRPDGTGSPADGNALRCCARAIADRYGYRSATLITVGYAYESCLAGDDIGLRFPALRDILGPLRVHQRTVYRLWTGADNLVTFVDDLHDIDLAAEGPALRGHPRFGPAGVHVNFAEIRGPGRLRIRTHDREAEAEILSSGTGSLAAALLARRLGFCAENHIDVEAYSGGSLHMHLGDAAQEETWLYGPVLSVFEGEIPWP
ncbi:MAG TPA: hypothetical protein VNF47_08815 [Streptosporangiaceae bacterium]|nr:hypothetical protein [Streptosporangiaceae bacterium]